MRQFSRAPVHLHCVGKLADLGTDGASCPTRPHSPSLPYNCVLAGLCTLHKDAAQSALRHPLMEQNHTDARGACMTVELGVGFVPTAQFCLQTVKLVPNIQALACFIYYMCWPEREVKGPSSTHPP